MAHLKADATRAQLTGTEWLMTGAQIGKLVNIWARRADLVVYVGPGAGGPAPAAYNPALSEIEVNTDAAFGFGVEPQVIGDMTDRDTQYEWPKASGAIFHEACHARYSRWSMPNAADALSGAEFEALQLLEEGRIEAHGVAETRENREFLRACALEIVISDIDAAAENLNTIAAGAKLAALTLARVDAGVLDIDDLGEIPTLLEELLGAELLSKLRSIWNQVQMHDDHHDAVPMYEHAIEWVKTVSESQKEHGEETQDDIERRIAEILKALQEAADIAEINATGELGEVQQGEAWARIAGDKSAASKEIASHKKVMKKVFDEVKHPGDSGSKSRLTSRRTPSPTERAAAVKVAQMLDKAKYRERSQTEIKSVTPPGRLRTRALIQGSAAKSKGLMTQVEPWRRTQRKHTDDPTLKIGVMVDISGSMGSAMEPMAVTAWVLSEASRRADAKCAMVYYGQGVFSTLRPGQHLTDVSVYSAPDGTEKFDQAFKALDGSLGLLHSDGARLLVIVSDGWYTPEERDATTNWVKRCHAAGVAVLWITYSTVEQLTSYLKNTDAVAVQVTDDTSVAATKIGEAAVKALNKIGQRAA
jgi:hypothetical protein